MRVRRCWALNLSRWTLRYRFQTCYLAYGRTGIMFTGTLTLPQLAQMVVPDGRTYQLADPQGQTCGRGSSCGGPGG